MNKKCYRYFAGLIQSQEKWLNKMAARGYRLVRTGKALYEFAACEAGEYQYCVEFIGGKSRSRAEDYKQFLEDMGYRVFYKNLNLQWSVGKARWHPWAEKGGRIATSATTLDRELLIVEKRSDGKPFALHTTTEDKIQNLKQMQKPWGFSMLMFGACGLIMRHWLWMLLVGFYLIPATLYQVEIWKLNKEASAKEW